MSFLIFQDNYRIRGIRTVDSFKIGYYVYDSEREILATYLGITKEALCENLYCINRTDNYFIITEMKEADFKATKIVHIKMLQVLAYTFDSISMFKSGPEFVSRRIMLENNPWQNTRIEVIRKIVRRRMKYEKPTSDTNVRYNIDYSLINRSR